MSAPASDDFVGLVARMRRAQKWWFRLRDHAALEESKRLEREVDRAIDAQAEPTLFDRTDG